MSRRSAIAAVATALAVTFIASCSSNSQPPDLANDAAVDPNSPPLAGLVSIDFPSSVSNPGPTAQAWGPVIFREPGVSGTLVITALPDTSGTALAISKIQANPDVPGFNCRPSRPNEWTCKPSIDDGPDVWRTTNFKLGLTAQAGLTPQSVQVQFLLNGIDPIASDTFTVASQATQ